MKPTFAKYISPYQGKNSNKHITILSLNGRIILTVSDGSKAVGQCSIKSSELINKTYDDNKDFFRKAACLIYGTRYAEGNPHVTNSQYHELCDEISRFA